MSRLGRMLAMPRSLGRRLILAFVTIMALTGAMGMAAYVMWDRLGRQIHLIVEESLPAIDSAYQLERASSRLLLLLAQLRDTRDPVQYQRLSNAVSTTLRDIQRAYLLGTPGDQTPSQRQAFEELSALVADHGRYLKQQIEHAETLQQLQKRSNWLHQDLVDDAAPLLQEVEWHLTSMVASPDDMSEFGNVIKEFSALQDLTFKENELQSLVGEVIAQRYQQDLESAFLFIGYKIDEIDALTSRLAEYPSTVSYRQILQDIITLVKPDGPLHRLLLADVLTHQQLTALRPRLDDAVSRYHQRVSLMVSDANRSLSALGEDSSQLVATGKLVILVVLALTLLLSIFVLVVLIGRRLIKRLDLLGQELDRVAAGRLDVPVSTCGRDEIGRWATACATSACSCSRWSGPMPSISSTTPRPVSSPAIRMAPSSRSTRARSPCSSRPASSRASRCGRPFHQRRGRCWPISSGPASRCTGSATASAPWLVGWVRRPAFCTSTCVASSRGAGTGSSSPSRMLPARS